MKTTMAVLALFSLAADPVFAAGSPDFPRSSPQCAYYRVNPNSPALAGGGIGHYWLQPVS